MSFESVPVIGEVSTSLALCILCILIVFLKKKPLFNDNSFD